MIGFNMKTYNYFTYENKNAYGQPQLSAEPTGAIKAAIYLTSQSTQDNVNYKNANYVALTLDDITDKCVIEYGAEKLKVIYVAPYGRYKQAFLVKQ